MGEVYRGGQEALETIEAASPEENGLSLELRLLRDRVDLLHVAAREPATRWYRDVRGIVSVLALAVSLFGAAYTLVADRATEARARRHELKRIIQTLAEMRLTNARDMAVVTDQELRQRIDNVMLQKQRMLLEAADGIVDAIPDDITPAEYTTLAWENGGARQFAAEERYLGRALDGSAAPMKQVYAMRNLALFYFDRVNALEKGRKMFTQSADLVKRELGREPADAYRIELASTYRMWADAERRHGQATEGDALVQLAANYDQGAAAAAPDVAAAGQDDRAPFPGVRTVEAGMR